MGQTKQIERQQLRMGAKIKKQKHPQKHGQDRILCSAHNCRILGQGTIKKHADKSTHGRYADEMATRRCSQ